MILACAVEMSLSAAGDEISRILFLEGLLPYHGYKT